MENASCLDLQVWCPLGSRCLRLQRVTRPVLCAVIPTVRVRPPSRCYASVSVACLSGAWRCQSSQGSKFAFSGSISRPRNMRQYRGHNASPDGVHRVRQTTCTAAVLNADASSGRTTGLQGGALCFVLLTRRRATFTCSRRPKTGRRKN